MTQVMSVRLEDPGIALDRHNQRSQRYTPALTVDGPDGKDLRAAGSGRRFAEPPRARRHTWGMARLIPVPDPADPRLADYVRLRDVNLRKSLEAEHGLFVAEGEKVIRRAVAAATPSAPC